MSNYIKILPDSLANQIAAGEVIQRPASVIKELVENAIDAKATNISINIKDSGRTLIQVIDNGSGMSVDDARLAFERHATSKIDSADDLFAIQSKGFRGEALASVAAVAKVELKTKQEQEDVGTLIEIEASSVVNVESINAPKGSNFSVRDLFYNIPVRRKFLKSDRTEFSHILTELNRVILPHFEVAFTLYHNDKLIFKINSSNLKERIINVFDKSYLKQLVNIFADAGFVKISGFVGRPEFASKTNPKQFFFVNNRFMKSGYFHKAVTMAFGNLLNTDYKPNYFIFFEISPEKIDVNIHPTKTEINFEDAGGIFQILISSIRKFLTEFDIPPAIDFDDTEFVNLPSFDKNKEVKMPEVDLNLEYNPFNSDEREINFHSKISQSKDSISDIDDVFGEFEAKKTVSSSSQFINLKNKFVFTPVKSGVMIINIRRALRQIKFEELSSKISNNKSSIETFYPISISFSAEELVAFEDIYTQLEEIGFKFETIDNSSYNVVAVPPYLNMDDVTDLINNLIRLNQLSEPDVQKISKDEIVMLFLEKEKIDFNSQLNIQEQEQLVNKLFTCKSHQYTFDGKTIINIIDMDYFESLFK
ncbi:MAG: DNA mismatch repair endonuclease MutL [Bacteroidota bacterium]|nr:DNA mismatch repair endonuclease MutL [Bacteroidota bacterium]